MQVDVSFVINYCAEYGQQVVLLGSCQELGSWDTAAAVRLTWQQGDNWKAAVQLPAPIDRYVLALNAQIISKKQFALHGRPALVLMLCVNWKEACQSLDYSTRLCLS